MAAHKTENSDSAEATKELILNAACTRFAKYGYNKTTMAEIAGDCKMSAANLYRFFASKSDIGAGIAMNIFAAKETEWRAIVRKPKMSASNRLEELVLWDFRHTYETFSNRPAITELVAFISNERQDLLRRHKETNRALLAEVLAEGNRSGEFDVADILSTAEWVQAAASFYFFRIVQMQMSCDDTPEGLEQLTLGVIQLLIRGLAKR